MTSTAFQGHAENPHGPAYTPGPLVTPPPMSSLHKEDEVGIENEHANTFAIY